MSITGTLIVQMIVFLILVGFTMKFVWPPIAKALDERAVKIADGLAAADRAKTELAAADKRFPVNPPQTKEAYYYRSLFEAFYPGPAAAETVPGGKSIACSSPAAIAWDASFASAADPSGRAIAGVHSAAL